MGDRTTCGVMQNFTLLLLPFLLFGCVTGSPKVTDVETIVCDFSSSTLLYQCEWIESISFTLLDKDCLIGTEPEVRILGDNLFVKHGSFQDFRFDRFSTSGAYLNQIGRLGRGPGEMSGWLSDWFIYNDDMIGVYISGSKSILLYDFDGNYVREVDFTTNALMIHSQGTNFWAFMPPIADSSRLICISGTGKELSSFIESEKTYHTYGDLWRPFYSTNGKLYIGLPYSSTIYMAEKESLSAAFVVDAGKYAIPLKFYDDVTFDFFRQMEKEGYAAVYNLLDG